MWLTVPVSGSVVREEAHVSVCFMTFKQSTFSSSGTSYLSEGDFFCVIYYVSFLFAVHVGFSVSSNGP